VPRSNSALALASPTGEIVLRKSEGVCRGEGSGWMPSEAARSYGYNSVFYVREARLP